MAKISAIIPIFNDSQFINLCVSSIIDAVDEVIFVDGSPFGASTDDPESVVDKKFPKEKIKFVYGTFADNGRWDKKAQLEMGCEEAKNDYLMFLSIDMILDQSKVLLDIPEKYDEVWCNSYEFWLDTGNLRVENGNPTKMVCLGGRRELIDEQKDFRSRTTKIFLPNTMRYHFGWIRPFGQQVAKHVRHIQEGAWGDLGKDVRALDDEGIEVWAIQHVLRYKNSDSIRIPELITDLQVPDMKYLDGFSDFQKDFEKRTGKEFYVGITQIPTNLIV